MWRDLLIEYCQTSSLKACCQTEGKFLRMQLQTLPKLVIEISPLVQGFHRRIQCYCGTLTSRRKTDRLLRRLNFRLTDKCEDDIETLCGDACNIYTNQACGGRVLRCLTDKQEQVKSKVCTGDQLLVPLHKPLGLGMIEN